MPVDTVQLADDKELLQTEGLANIRRQEKSEFIGFVPNDSGYRRDAALTIQETGALDEAQKQQLFNLVEVACINPDLGLLPFGLSISDIERLAYDMSDRAGRANRAVPPEAGWDSLAENICLARREAAGAFLRPVKAG